MWIGYLRPCGGRELQELCFELVGGTVRVSQISTVKVDGICRKASLLDHVYNENEAVQWIVTTSSISLH